MDNNKIKRMRQVVNKVCKLERNIIEQLLSNLLYEIENQTKDKEIIDNLIKKTINANE